jgi:hypothetical protein
VRSGERFAPIRRAPRSGHQRHLVGRRRQRRPADGRVRHHDVVAIQPQRLGQREGEDAGQPGVERPVDQRPAAHRLGRQPYALAARAAQQVGRVRVERVEIDGDERRVQIGGGGVEGRQHDEHATHRRAVR